MYCLPCGGLGTYCACKNKGTACRAVGIVHYLGLDKMKSSWILELFFISSPYSFILVGFLPTIPTLAIFDFVAIIEAETANNPGGI